MKETNAHNAQTRNAQTHNAQTHNAQTHNAQTHNAQTHNAQTRNAQTRNVPGFSDAEESRDNESQRRLMTGRDFVSDKVHAPEDIEIKIDPKTLASSRTATTAPSSSAR